MSRKSAYPANGAELRHIQTRQARDYMRRYKKAQQRAKFWALREAATKDPAARQAFENFKHGVLAS